MDIKLVKDYISEKLASPLPPLIKRNIKLEVGENKALSLIGPRRAGKTYLLFQKMSELNRKETIYLDFEDIALVNISASDCMRIITDLFTEVSGNRAKNVLLDEVQNLDNWATLVRTLVDRGYRVYITGSSSKLMASEVATQLRGRSVSILVLPFSFKEYLMAKGYSIDLNNLTSIGKLKSELNRYLDFGGYPEVVLHEENAENILRDYKELIFFKDFVERAGVRSIEVARLLFNFAMQSFSSEISIRKIARAINSQGIGFNIGTIYNYFRKLEDTMVIFLLDRYSTKVIARLSWPKKIYLADTGLAFRQGQDIGRLMENAVFLQLKRRQQNQAFEIYYYRDQNKEVDFVIKTQKGIAELLQVTYASSKSDIKEKEINSLLDVGKLLGCNNLTIVTWDYEDKIEKDNQTINVIPLWKWLLM